MASGTPVGPFLCKTQNQAGFWRRPIWCTLRSWEWTGAVALIQHVKRSLSACLDGKYEVRGRLWKMVWDDFHTVAFSRRRWQFAFNKASVGRKRLHLILALWAVLGQLLSNRTVTYWVTHRGFGGQLFSFRASWKFWAFNFAYVHLIAEELCCHAVCFHLHLCSPYYWL